MIETFRLIQYQEDWKTFENKPPSEFEIYKIQCKAVEGELGSIDRKEIFLCEKEYISLKKPKKEDD